MLSNRQALSGILLFGLVLTAFSLTIDYPRLAGGFWSDGATYYSMAHSLARDGDLLFERGDVQRVFEEFEGGPSGIFLKRGRELDLTLTRKVPFLVSKGPLNDKLYFAKAFLYSLAAAPFVVIFGTNGLLVLHSLLFTSILLAGYYFLSESMSRGWALTLSATFFLASVVPAYFVWLTPELFNLSLVFWGGFFWLYKERAADPPRWLSGWRSDVLAAAAWGAVAYSKPNNVFLIVPLVVLFLWRRQWRRAVISGGAFAAVLGGLFLAQLFINGEMNYQGGDRKTFGGRYPYQRTELTFENTGLGMTTNEIYTQQPWHIVAYDLFYFHFGRFTGISIYYFPAVAGILIFLGSRKKKLWEWFILGIATFGWLLLIVWIPVDYFGGGGALGNRYFMNIYPLYFFLLSAVRNPARWIAIAWIIAGLFLAPILIDPFEAGRQPGQHATTGIFKWLPPELSLINKLPTNNDPAKFRQRFDNGYLGYFLDDNTWGKERRAPGGLGFHVRGGTEAEVVARTAVRLDRLIVRVTNVTSKPNHIRVCVPGGCETRELDPGIKEIWELPSGRPFVYEDFGVQTYCYLVKVWVEQGEVPILRRRGTKDSRFLGAFIHIEPDPYPGIQ